MPAYIVHSAYMPKIYSVGGIQLATFREPLITIPKSKECTPGFCMLKKCAYKRRQCRSARYKENECRYDEQ